MSSEGELGNVGEPSVSLRTTRSGGPGAQRPWRRLGLPPGDEPVGDTTNSGSTHGIGERATSTGPRAGQGAVVAAHRTGESGEVRPKRPTGGQEASGRACKGQTHERDCALTNRVTRPPWDCTKGQQRLCLRNRMRSLRTYGSVGGPDGQPSALPGKRRLPGAPDAQRSAS